MDTTVRVNIAVISIHISVFSISPFMVFSAILNQGTTNWLTE